ncbi:heavy metal-associated isoprenylated plant protein 3-like [Lolium rigidum]|uniref:heavy metal-associated isoprenylated plant protein 3-like n=1 Tax=Lolium rigidum TaxID=89674 RepID=UPI001F5E226D|nr:heavy metal-associated isoprenylated plant protein 3-like [Lolium rigidum]
MGKKKSGNAGGGGAEEAREFVLKVAMHCRCNGCKGKVRAAVRDITMDPGVEAADSSAAESSGEVRLLATADPERLRRRLHKATGKKVDLLLPKEPAPSKKQENADAATLQALLAQLQLQAPAPARQQYGGQGAAPWVKVAFDEHNLIDPNFNKVQFEQAV